jgi:Flp pilus assembly protein TadG
MRRLQDLLKRFRRDESGSFLVIFALLAIVLIATSGAVVDFTYTQTARSRAQTAIDAAALALQPKVNAVIAGTITKTDAEADIKTKAQSILQERLNDSSITATIDTATINTSQGTLNLTGSITVPTAFVQLVGIRNITARLTSEVTPGSKDLEVSVALDTTGSMSGSKISDLKSATNTLIDLVVKPQQTPTYSKMAIIPWSVAVNMSLASGNYDTGKTVADVRGTPTPSTTITAASWMKTTTVSINSITKANPAVITTNANHNLQNGDYVWISGVSGMANGSGTPQIPDGVYKVNRLSNTTAQLLTLSSGSWVNVNSPSYTSYSTSPAKAKITGCYDYPCNVAITSTNHGLAAGDNVFISGVNGMTQLNNVKTSSGNTLLNGATVDPVVTILSANQFTTSDVTAATIGYGSAYTSGGTAQCVKYGCALFYFPSKTVDRWGNITAQGYTIYEPNTCVTERTGTHAFDDQPPTTVPLGINYAALSNNVPTPCLGQKPQPLTSSISTLKAVVTSLSAAGSTAGHLGLAWGWYMISPNFGYLWPTASRPAAYGRNNLIKAVVLMTDGLFNIQYCEGVITPEDPADGNNPPGTTTYSKCSPPPNGYSKAQAIALCNAIKAESNHITLYTVGFDLGTDQDSLDFLQGCATSPSKFFRADTGTDLTNSFKKIAEDLNSLRISH